MCRTHMAPPTFNMLEARLSEGLFQFRQYLALSELMLVWEFTWLLSCLSLLWLRGEVSYSLSSGQTGIFPI